MPPVLVIDACVLYSAALRDILLRCAEIGIRLAHRVHLTDAAPHYGLSLLEVVP
jgi:hypothetical protein